MKVNDLIVSNVNLGNGSIIIVKRKTEEFLEFDSYAQIIETMPWLLEHEVFYWEVKVLKIIEVDEYRNETDFQLIININV